MSYVRLSLIILVFCCNIRGIAQNAAPVASNPDQSYVLDARPIVIDTPSSLNGDGSTHGSAPDTKPPAGIDEPTIKGLVQTALNAQRAQAIQKDTYYVLHLVQYRDGTPGSMTDAWYIYFCGWEDAQGSCARPLSWRLKLNDPDWQKHYKEARMFGARKLSLLYIHYNIPIGALPEEAKRDNLRIANVRGPNNEKVVAASGSSANALEGGFTESPFLPITYTISISKKTPTIVDNLKTVLGQFGLQGAGTALFLTDLRYRALTGAKLDMNINYPTSDITIAGQRGQDRTNIGSQKIDNERKYFLDFGFAIPLSKIKELQLNGPALIPQPVDKSRIYGMVSLFPLGPVDTKASRVWFRAPQLMYGMALNSKPWDNHLFAIGFLNKYVQPFVGVTLTNKQATAPTANNAGLRWSSRIAYGIQVSAGSISSFIKKSSK